MLIQLQTPEITLPHRAGMALGPSSRAMTQSPHHRSPKPGLKFSYNFDCLGSLDPLYIAAIKYFLVGIINSEPIVLSPSSHFSSRWERNQLSQRASAFKQSWNRYPTLLKGPSPKKQLAIFQPKFPKTSMSLDTQSSNL